MPHQATKEELLAQKVEVTLDATDTKSVVMRIDMKTNVVTYAVTKPGTPVQLFTNFAAAFGAYHK